MTGIDVSAEMVERARLALSDFPNVRLLVGSGRDLGEVPDGHADVVYFGIRKMLRRRPRGVLGPHWLGSAVDRAGLLQAISDGGLVLDATVGDGSQFCLVHAHRPG